MDPEVGLLVASIVVSGKGVLFPRGPLLCRKEKREPKQQQEKKREPFSVCALNGNACQETAAFTK